MFRLRNHLFLAGMLFSASTFTGMAVADDTTPSTGTVAQGEGSEFERSVAADPAFDRIVTLSLAGRAVADQDASLLADVALQLQQGEQVLMRHHQSGITSAYLFGKAAELASAAGDQATMDRLATVAKKAGNETLSQKLQAIKALGAASRHVAPDFPIDIQNVDVDTYARFHQFMSAARSAELAGDKAQIRALQAEIEAASLPESQARKLRDWSNELLEAAPEATPESAALGQLLADTRSPWYTRPGDWMSTGPKIFKPQNDGGYTSGWAMESSTPPQNDSIQFDNQEKRQFSFSLWNSCDRFIHVRTPTGRVDSIAPGSTKQYRFNGNAKDAVMEVIEAKRSYRMRAGNHKLWWMKKEGRAGLDLNY